MQIFLDSAEFDEIAELAQTGLVNGLTTNPSLVAKTGKPFFELVQALAGVISGPISAEVVAMEAGPMVEQGKKLAGLAENIVVKLPLSWEGLKACQTLRREGINTNVTLCFSVNQALMAGNAGATYVSPFIGRLDDQGQSGVELIADMVALFSNYPAIETQILAASIRSTDHVRAVALAGADCATLPTAIFRRLLDHALTEKGLAAFLADWQKTGQSF